MCGIVGIINKNHYPVDQSTLEKMSAKIAHRGPDSSGIYFSDNRDIAFAHRRLSLVDLSNHGAQPMQKHNRVVVFNGEVYNFRIIRQELEAFGYVFSSTSDTEVILSAFDKWGIECLDKFNGAFAFILYDKNKSEIYVVRDRLGEKPLYYMQVGETILIASEVKAIAQHPNVKLSPNLKRIKMDLIFNFWADKEESYFENIFSVQPGHYLKINENIIQKVKYWDLKMSEGLVTKNEITRLNIDTYVKNIYGLLVDATKMRIDADVKIGSMLSGGIDSSLITVIAAKYSIDPVECFTLFHESSNDEDFVCAKLLANEIPNIIDYPVPIKKETFTIEKIDHTIYQMEEVLLDKIYVYVNNNYKMAKEHNLKAVINGQGSDEITLGYYKYYPLLQSDFSLFEKDNFANYWEDQYFLKDYVDRDETKKLVLQNLEKAYYPYISEDLLNSVSAFGIKTHLLDLLAQEDKLSMSEGVECRTVFTDYRFAEEFMKIPSCVKVLDGREKYLIRELAKKILPPRIVNREKLGFPDFDDRSNEIVAEIINDPEFRKSKILNAIVDKKMFSDIDKLPEGKRWKLANIFRFEKVFFS